MIFAVWKMSNNKHSMSQTSLGLPSVLQGYQLPFCHVDVPFNERQTPLSDTGQTDTTVLNPVT